MDDWKKIKKEYISGTISYRKLAEKYGVSRTTLERKAKDEKWTELRRQAERKTEAKLLESVSSRNARLDEAVNLALDAACKYLTSPGQLRAQDLKDITTALKNLRELKGIKSDADMEEQRARIDALRARTAVAKSDGADECGIIVLPDVLSGDIPGGASGDVIPDGVSDADILLLPRDDGKEGEKGK